MIELRLRTSKDGLRGTFIYDEHINKSLDKTVEPLSRVASEEDIQDLLNTLNKYPKLIERNYFSGNDMEFIIKDKMKVVLKNRNNFKKDPNFKFIFNKIRNKKYKLIRKAITTVIMTGVITVSSLIVPSVINATEEEFNKNIENGNIGLTNLDIENRFMDRKFDIEKTSPLIEKLEKEFKMDERSVVVRPREEREKEALEKLYKSIYKSKEEKGFVVTIDNKTYDLNQAETELLMAITAAECDKSLDDALATVSVILNRCETEKWINSYGTNPISQATAPGQFSVYSSKAYEKYLEEVPEEVQKAVEDALNGVRNNEYTRFNSNATKNYSDNMITETGNRYK